jgi:hypothetical protein
MFKSIASALGRIFSSISGAFSEAFNGLLHDGRWVFDRMVRRPFLWCSDAWDVVQPYAARTAQIASTIVEYPFRLIGLAMGGAGAANDRTMDALQAAAANDNAARAAEAEAQRLEVAARREYESQQREAEAEKARMCQFDSFEVACVQQAAALYEGNASYRPDTTILTHKQAAWVEQMNAQEATVIHGGKVSLRALADFGRGRREISGFRPLKSADMKRAAEIEERRNRVAGEYAQEIHQRNGRFSR